MGAFGSKGVSQENINGIRTNLKSVHNNLKIIHGKVNKKNTQGANNGSNYEEENNNFGESSAAPLIKNPSYINKSIVRLNGHTNTLRTTINTKAEERRLANFKRAEEQRLANLSKVATPAPLAASATLAAAAPLAAPLAAAAPLPASAQAPALEANPDEITTLMNSEKGKQFIPNNSNIKSNVLKLKQGISTPGRDESIKKIKTKALAATGEEKEFWNLILFHAGENKARGGRRYRKRRAHTRSRRNRRNTKKNRKNHI